MKNKLVMLLAIFAFSTTAFAELLVSPSRIAFGERDRVKEVILLNNTNEVRSYKIEWINQSQGSTGSYQRLTETELDEFPTAEKFIRYSPRRVTLQPNESQTIKLMVRRKADMNQPEYRSHLLFTALPRSLTDDTETQEETPDGVSIKLNLLLSYSIPIILRTEKPTTELEFDDIKFLKNSNGKDAVGFTLKKRSDNSVYGDFTITHELNGVEQDVGYLNNVNIFREVDEYSTTVNLLKPVLDNGGKIKITYKGNAEFTDKLLEEVTKPVR